jgi:uncharacterized protein (TIGR00290 family)
MDTRVISPEPVLVSWSGGKDCTMALDAMRGDPRYTPVGLLCTLTRGTDRVAAHGLRRHVTMAQAAAMGLPVIEMWLDAGAGNAEYELALADALRRAESLAPGLRTVAYGDLMLQDVRDWRDQCLARLGWRTHYPLWMSDTTTLARRIIDGGILAHVVSVDTTRIPAELAGAPYDDAFLARLPQGTDPCGENGEFHTFVSWAPGWSRPVRFITARQWTSPDGRFVHCDVVPAPTLELDPV